jgi:hypothetical protein
MRPRGAGAPQLQPPMPARMWRAALWQTTSNGNPTMTRLLLSLCVLAFAATSAQAGPLNPTTTDRFKLVISGAAGAVADGLVEHSFDAKSYTNFDGSRAGSVSVSSFGIVAGNFIFSFVQCLDLPELADAVNLNQSTGAVTVNAVLDPTRCNALNYDGGPLTVRLTGRFDGSERFTESGTVTRQIFGFTEKMNYQGENFRDAFDGTIGIYTGQLLGNATYGRSTNRTQTK